MTGTPDVSTLTKETLKELKLVPEGIPDAARGADGIKRLLSNLGTIGNGLAELRGLYGTGHGKHGSEKLAFHRAGRNRPIRGRALRCYEPRLRLNRGLFWDAYVDSRRYLERKSPNLSGSGFCKLWFGSGQLLLTAFLFHAECKQGERVQGYGFGGVSIAGPKVQIVPFLHFNRHVKCGALHVTADLLQDF